MKSQSLPIVDDGRQSCDNVFHTLSFCDVPLHVARMFFRKYDAFRKENLEVWQTWITDSILCNICVWIVWKKKRRRSWYTCRCRRIVSVFRSFFYRYFHFVLFFLRLERYVASELPKKNVSSSTKPACTLSFIDLDLTLTVECVITFSLEFESTSNSTFSYQEVAALTSRFINLDFENGCVTYKKKSSGKYCQGYFS